MADLTDREILALAEQHGAFSADDARGLILWEHMQPGGLLAFARALLNRAAGVPATPEWSDSDERLYQRTRGAKAPAPTLRHNQHLCADCTTENSCQNRLDLPRPCWGTAGVDSSRADQVKGGA